MGYFDEETFSFLRELKRHNDRAWFAANKQRYEESVKEPFLRLIEDLGPELRKVSRNLVADPRPVGGSMFRIYRDVRFSKENRPGWDRAVMNRVRDERYGGGRLLDSSNGPVAIRAHRSDHRQGR